MNADEIHFEVIDCKGCKIVCTKEQWFDHIAARPHEYMEDEEERVKEAIRSPDFGLRHKDKEYSKRRCYYRKSETEDYYVKVVVEFENENCDGDGRVITAYMPDDITPGEKPEL